MTGLAQEAKLAPSSRHWKAAVASPSLKAKVALVEAVTAGGVEVSVGAGGGVRSIVQL